LARPVATPPDPHARRATFRNRYGRPPGRRAAAPLYTYPVSAPLALSVMLIVPDAPAAVAWYRDALGATVLWDRGGVAGLDLDGAPFLLHGVNPRKSHETSPDQGGITSTRVEVFADDPDGFVEPALRGGARVGSEVRDHEVPWCTHRQGGFVDPFGHVWSVGERSPPSRFGSAGRSITRLRGAGRCVLATCPAVRSRRTRRRVGEDRRRRRAGRRRSRG
jgi:PhnB protein